MNGRLVCTCLAIWVVFAGGCNRPAELRHESAVDSYVAVPNSVVFDIEPLENGDGSSMWKATYEAGGKTAKFQIELGPTTPLDDEESRTMGAGTGKGKFIADPESDAGVLLADLKKALEARTLPKRTTRVSSLPFTFVTFGKRMSQDSNGGFAAAPPGNCTPMKIFLGEGEREGVVFLNINPVIKKGQFSIKDADYGDSVVAQLAKVL